MAPIRFSCPKCGVVLKQAEGPLPKKAKCPKCSTVFQPILIAAESGAPAKTPNKTTKQAIAPTKASSSNPASGAVNPFAKSADSTAGFPKEKPAFAGAPVPSSVQPNATTADKTFNADAVQTTKPNPNMPRGSIRLFIGIGGLAVLVAVATAVFWIGFAPATMLSTTGSLASTVAKPGDSASQSANDALNVGADGNVRFGAKSANLNQAESLIALGERFRDEVRLRKQSKSPTSGPIRIVDPGPFRIIADYSCNYGQLLQLIGLCHQSGFTDIRFSAVNGEEKHHQVGAMTVSVQAGELGKTLNKDELLYLDHDGEVERRLSRMKVTLRTKPDSTNIIIAVEGAPVPSMLRLPGHLELLSGAFRGATGEDDDGMSILLIASPDLSYALLLDFFESCRKANMAKIGFAQLGNDSEIFKIELEDHEIDLEKPVNLPKRNSELDKLRP